MAMKLAQLPYHIQRNILWHKLSFPIVYTLGYGFFSWLALKEIALTPTLAIGGILGVFRWFSSFNYVAHTEAKSEGISFWYQTSLWAKEQKAFHVPYTAITNFKTKEDFLGDPCTITLKYKDTEELHFTKKLLVCSKQQYIDAAYHLQNNVLPDSAV